MRTPKTFGGLTFYKGKQLKVLVVSTTKKNVHEQLAAFKLIVTNLNVTGNDKELELTKNHVNGVWVASDNSYNHTFTKLEK